MSTYRGPGDSVNNGQSFPTAEDIATAIASALAAQTAAETAQAAAETAETGAETAQTAAETAQTSAETAETNAAASASAAATSESNAAASASAAATSASNAAASAVAAATSETNAAASESAAAGHATDAYNYSLSALLLDGTRAMTGALNMGAQNITNVGTVDGRDVSADGTKLDGIESGATADQTDAEIAAALSGQTVTGLLSLGVSGNITVTGTVDGRDVATDGTKLDGIESGATADQTKADIDALGINATLLNGYAWGSLVGNFSTNDKVISGRGSGGVAMTINDGYGHANLTFNHTAGTPEQAGNIGRIVVNTDATTGAYMDFQVKSNSGTAPVAATSVFKIWETYVHVNGNISVTGNVDGRDVAADGTKLDGIESGATADQTASEILTAIKTVDGSGSGLDADLLDGMNASTASGASTIVARDGIADIKARLFRSAYPEQTTPPASTADVCFRNDTTNNYMRFMSLAAMKQWLGLDHFDIQFTLARGTDDTLTLNEYAQFGFTIDKVYCKTDAGSITASITINGTNVTGLGGLNLATTQGNHTATGANTVTAGDRVQIVLSSNSSAENVSLVIHCTRT